jgi:hypothetical protein
MMDDLRTALDGVRDQLGGHSAAWMAFEDRGEALQVALRFLAELDRHLADGRLLDPGILEQRAG